MLSFVFHSSLNTKLIQNRQKVRATGHVVSSTKKGRYYLSKLNIVDSNFDRKGCVLNILSKIQIQNGWKVFVKGKSVINPRLFYIGNDFKNAMKLRNECGTIFADKIEVLDDEVSFIEKLRQHIRLNILKHSKDVNSQGLILALIIGETGYIDKIYIDAIRNSGCAHILAISGLHVAILAVFLNFLFSKIVFFIKPSALNRINVHRAIQFFVLVFILFYVSLAGFSISAKRSFYMVGVAYLCFLFNRNTNSKSFLYFALIIFCIFSPQDVMSISFQLSFLATFTVISIYSKHNAFKDSGYLSRVFRYITSAFVSSFVVSFVISPIEMYYFNRIPMLSPIGNLLIVPVVEFFILPASFIASIFSIKPLFYLIDLASSFVYGAGFLISDLKFSYINVPQVHAWFSIVLLGLFFSIFFIKQKLTQLIFVIFSVIFVASYVYFYQEPSCIATGNLKNVVCKSRRKNVYCLIDFSKKYIVNNWETKLNSKIEECDDYDQFDYDLITNNKMPVDLIILKNGQLNIFN